MANTHSEPSYRRTLRHPGYDYSLAGVYFVTICSEGKVQSLGSIVDGVVTLSPAGAVVDEVMRSLPERFPFVSLDEHVVMPNHVHCVLLLGDPEGSETMPGHLGSVVRAFKAASTRLIRTAGLAAFAWQPNYYDHIVRTEADLQRIREYIAANPARWDEDPQNPLRNKVFGRSEPWAQ